MAQQNPEATPPDESISRRERRHHHDSPGIMGALIVIILGILLFLANQGIIEWDNWWKYFVTGIGLVLLIAGAIDYFRGNDRSLSGRIIAGIVLVGIGLTFLLEEFSFWPVIIIVVGLLMLLAAFRRRNR